MSRYVFATICAILWGAQAGLAWGPHPEITRAAVEVLPNLEQIKQQLGESNVAALTNYCWMPDQRGQDLGAFYADDYLLIPALPRHVGHTMPAVKETFEPYFRRALQALRTETATNACRQLGPLLHFVEDVGAPPHAKENCPHHGELENWVKSELITIRGYQPRLLGNTDDEALAGLLRRIEDLVAFSRDRAERALPLVSRPNPDRSQVELIILEAALETSRVTADVLYTVLSLGLKPDTRPGNSHLTLHVSAPATVTNNDQEARIVLLNTPFSTLTEASPTSSSDRWTGTAEFRYLPPGTYEVVAYRPGAQPGRTVVTLTEGGSTTVEISLQNTDPPQNLIYNPGFELRTLNVNSPDRWSVSATAAGKVWTSAAIGLKAGQRYRCGAAFKSDRGTVIFVAQPASGSGGSVQRWVLEPGGHQSASPEIEIVADADHPRLVVQISGPSDGPEIVHRVWVAPIP